MPMNFNREDSGRVGAKSLANLSDDSATVRIDTFESITTSSSGGGHMTTKRIATLQTIWDCRWSRLGHGIFGADDHLQPEMLWVCVRRGERRRITEEECENCPYWEAMPEPPNFH
jgi:hypothetical protein